MHTYRDTALVLRCQDLGEADRIITLLTAQYGVMRMVAKGARRTRSKFGARLEVFNSIDAMLILPRKVDGLGTITSVVNVFSPAAEIVSGYDKYITACIIVEVAHRLAGVEYTPTGKLLRLTMNALNAVAEDKRPYELIVLAYLLRAMAETGWLPSLFHCASCGEPGPHPAFGAAVGGVLCNSCRSGDYTTPGIEVMHMLYVVYMGKWDLVPMQDVPMHRRGLHIIIEYFRWHIGKGISSMSAFLMHDSEYRSISDFAQRLSMNVDTMGQDLSLSSNLHTWRETQSMAKPMAG